MRFFQTPPQVIYCRLAQLVALRTVCVMVVPTTLQPCLVAMLRGIWHLVAIATSALLCGGVHVPGIVPITEIIHNVLGMFLLEILGGCLMARRSTFVLLVRRGIVPAEIRSVAAILVSCVA